MSRLLTGPKNRLIQIGATGLEGAAPAGATASVSVAQLVFAAVIVTVVASGAYFALIPVFVRLNNQQSLLNSQTERLGSGNATLEDLASILNQTLGTIAGLQSRIDELEADAAESQLNEFQQQMQIDAIIQNEGSMMTTTEEVIVPVVDCYTAGDGACAMPTGLTGGTHTARILLVTTGQLIQFVLEIDNTTTSGSSTFSVYNNGGETLAYCIYDPMTYSSAWGTTLPLNANMGTAGIHIRGFTNDQLNSWQSPGYPNRKFRWLPSLYVDTYEMVYNAARTYFQIRTIMYQDGSPSPTVAPCGTPVTFSAEKTRFTIVSSLYAPLSFEKRKRDPAPLRSSKTSASFNPNNIPSAPMSRGLRRVAK